MLAVDSAAQAQRETGHFGERTLIWFVARNRASGAAEPVGFWTGRDTVTIAVTDLFTGATQSRAFIGSGSVVAVSPFRYEVGLNVRPVTLTLSPLSADVENAVRGYDLRGAKVQIWTQTLEPETERFVGAPERRFKGFVNDAEVLRPVDGGDASLEIELVSAARTLSMTNGLKKSHTNQKRRDPSDMFRKYKSIAREIVVPWGEEDARK